MVCMIRVAMMDALLNLINAHEQDDGEEGDDFYKLGANGRRRDGNDNKYNVHVRMFCGARRRRRRKKKVTSSVEFCAPTREERREEADNNNNNCFALLSPIYLTPHRFS